MKTPTLTRTGPAHPIAFFVQTPGDPILRLTHSPEKCPGTIIAGIQTRIGEHLLRAGALSSPFQVLPCPDCGTKTQYHELTCPRRARAKNLA